VEERIWHFEWNSSLSIGHPDIDNDHQDSINLISELIESILNMHPLKDIHQRMRRVMDHAERHFLSEEEVLQQWNYKDIDKHVSLHEAIMRKFDEIRRSMDNSTAMDYWIEAGLDVRDTLIDHFLHEDLKFRNLHLANK
jgi:hemerythrin-like metal-binding protein